MINLVKKWSLLIIVILAFITRILYLGSIPPVSDGFMNLRIYTAISGILSISLLYLIVRRLTSRKDLAFSSAISLIFLPWHIEQSRISSPAVWGLTLVLLGIWVISIVKAKQLKTTFIFLTILSVAIVFPELHIWRIGIDILPLNELLARMFRLVSVNYLFFKNDSFWSGGLREIGLMLPMVLPLFFLGLYQLGKHFDSKKWWLIVPPLVIWVLSAAQPKFPEQRLFFLVTPYIAYVLGIGLISLYQIWKQDHIWAKAFSILLIFMIGYNYFVFFHYYGWHYSQRIKNELNSEQQNF